MTYDPEGNVVFPDADEVKAAELGTRRIGDRVVPVDSDEAPGAVGGGGVVDFRTQPLPETGHEESTWNEVSSSRDSTKTFRRN